jgi:endo-1,4-beta-xylanase
MPEWLLKQESSVTPDKAKSLLSDYIHTIVSRYRGKIQLWDVVNEAIDEVRTNSHPFNIRDSFWFRKLGLDFIKYTFMFAHEADPDTKLYYNDYNIETLGTKSDRALALANWLKSEEATIDGVGIQWYTDVSKNIKHW